MNRKPIKHNPLILVLDAGHNMAEAIDKLERCRDDISLEDCAMAKRIWIAAASAFNVPRKRKAKR